MIECENRTVLQSIGLMGTDRRLHHRSDWQPGFSQRRMLRIPLIPSNVVPEANPGAEEFRLHVAVAGETLHDTIYTPGQARTLGYVEMEWDGLDAYGRPADDRVQVAQVTVDVFYPGAESDNPNFNDPTGSPAERAQLRIRPDGTIIRRTQYEVDLEPRFDDSSIAAGGWMISGYHRLEPDGFVWRGDGGVRSPATRVESTTLDADSQSSGPPVGGPLASLRTGEIVMVQGGTKCLVRFDPENPGSEEVILGSCIEEVPTGRAISDFAFGQPATDSRFGGIAGVHVAPNGDLYAWQSDSFRKDRPSLIVRMRPLSQAKG